MAQLFLYKLIVYLVLFEFFPCNLVELLGCESYLCYGYVLVLGEAVVDTLGAGKGDDVAYLVEVEVGTNAVRVKVLLLVVNLTVVTCQVEAVLVMREVSVTDVIDAFAIAKGVNIHIRVK